jgi:hypothetical protein
MVIFLFCLPVSQELQQWRNRLQKEPGYTSLETDCQQIEMCIQIGLVCVNPERTKRPTMKKIINLLEGFESMNWYISNEVTSCIPDMLKSRYCVVYIVHNIYFFPILESAKHYITIFVPRK